jgi:site-specific DNA-methyltransferase (adenine-specific)
MPLINIDPDVLKPQEQTFKSQLVEPEPDYKSELVTWPADQSWSIFMGECAKVMAKWPTECIDSIVTDPPYGLSFMNKAWDNVEYGFHKEWADQAFRVLKPGGHLIAFSGSRTYHWLAAAVEDAGFEIRDMLMWLYGQGFPKSRNMGKDDPEWEGWGTALKPAHEPIVLARKPLSEKNVIENLREHGTGALHIDASRIATSDSLGGGAQSATTRDTKTNEGWQRPWMDDPESREKHAAQIRANVEKAEVLGRFPANLILSHHPDCEYLGLKKVKAIKGGRKANITESGVYGGGKGIGATSTKGLTADDVRGDPGYGDEDGNETVEAWNCHEDCAVFLLDEQTGTLKSGSWDGKRKADKFGEVYGEFEGQIETPIMGSEGGASRFFYNAKASKKEREKGLKGHIPCTRCEGIDTDTHINPKTGKPQKCVRNDHPTVKPVALMEYLVRLVTPIGGVVLDPFLGSGTTGVAAVSQGFRFVGVEKDDAYLPLAEARIKSA